MKAPAKILLTSLSGQLGGMELRMADVARLLTLQGHHPLIAISPFEGSADYLGHLKAKGYSLANFNPPPFFEEWRWHRLNLLKAQFLTLPALRRGKFDLAHIFIAWTLYGGSRLWLCHRAGVPCVLSVHGAFLPHTLSTWHAKLMQSAFNSVRGIYAVSQSALERFLAVYGTLVRSDTKMRVIHNFVDTDLFRPCHTTRISARDELDIPQTATLIGSIGRLDANKNPLALLEILKYLRTRNIDAYLLILGKGPMLEDVRTAVTEMSLSTWVRILGYRNDPATYFCALDLHLLLSKQEGFGTSTIEAMSCGVPVLATDVPGSRDILLHSNAGHLVAYGEWQTAAETVVSMLSDTTKLASAAIAARTECLEKFSRPSWEKQLAAFYAAI